MSWDQRLDRPVVLPDDKALRTLEDARLHILALPKSKYETTAWQVAIEALVLAARVHDAEIKIAEGPEPPREDPYNSNPVCTENLNPNVVMMKSAQDGVRTYDA